MNPVVHFEMPYEDKSRVAAFYAEAFGWQTQATGPDMGDYVLATTAETVNGRPAAPGTINGGFFPKKPDWPAQFPSVVIAVDNLAESMARVNKLGGKVLGEPMDIPG
ncbi:MAG TPA: VOC family protein, partial [Albitalea sp.]|nr:VOC family protein [Albitalea sp.]